MAWLSNNSFTTSDKLLNVDLNNLANDIRNWGGDVNGGGFNLYNCTISGVFTDPTTTVGDLIVHGPTAGTVGSLQRLPIGTTDGLALVIDHTQTLGVKWGVAAQGMLDPTTTKGDLIAKPSGAPPTRLPVGADSHILICDSSQSTGLRWGTITGFAAPGSDTQVMLNQAGVPGASPNLVFNYSTGHLLVGGGADDGSAAVVQVTGITHTTMRIRSDMVFSPKAWPSSSSYVSPDAGYGGIGYQGASVYWYWNGAAYAAVDFSKLAAILSDPTTTLGDLIVRGSSAVARFPVGANSYMLVADSTQPLGLRWQPPPAIGVTSAFGRTGAVIAQAGDYTVSMVTNAVDATQSYANPAWITSLPWSKITTAPQFLVDPTTAKGDLITRTSSATTRIVVGTDGQQLTADSTQSTGLRWASPSTMVVTTISPGALSGAVIFTAGANVSLSQITNSSGQQIAISVPNINSSTGMADPTTSQGDLIVHGLTAGTTRMPVGTAGQILTVDTTQDLGMKWAAPAAFVGVTSLSPGALTGAVTLLGGSNVLISQSAQNITIGVPNVMVDPMTTKGDLVVHGTATTRLPVGTDGQVLSADSTQVLGVKWATAAAGTAAGADQQVQVNKAGAMGASPNLLFDYNNGYLTLTGPTGPNTVVAQFVYTGAQASLGCNWASHVARGTSAAPTALQAGDKLTGLRGFGYDGANSQLDAEIAMFAESTFTSGVGYGNIVFQTNNGAATITERMRISAAGLVGIGTSSPTEALDVTGHVRMRYVTGTGAGFWLDNSTAAEQCFVGLNAATNSWRLFSTISGQNHLSVNLDPAVNGVATIVGDASNLTTTMSAAQLIITGSPATGNTNKSLWIGFGTTNNVGVIQAGIAGTGYNNLLLNPLGGSVGIGTATPGGALAVRTGANENLCVTTDGTVLIVQAMNDANSAYVPLSYRASVHEFSGGNVGIGTATPGVPLDVAGAIRSTATGIDMRIQAGAGGGGGVGTFSNTPVLMFANSTEYMRLTSAGNVGIGTSTPASQLHVYGAGTTKTSYTNGDATGGTIYLQDSGAGANNGGQILFGSSFGISSAIKCVVTNSTGPAGDLIFMTRTTSGDVVERMRVAATSYVGIGTSNPLVPFQVRTTTNENLFIADGGGGFLGISAVNDANTANTPMKLSASVFQFAIGNVGIAKAPAYALDVSGDLNITGTYRVNGNPISTGGGGVTSIAANAPITASASTGAVTLGYTGISSLATNTSTNLSLSGSTGAVTIGFFGVTVFLNGSSVATATRPAINFAAGINMSVSGNDGGSQTNVTYAYTSDRILKRNIRDLEGGLSIVNRLRPVSFEWNGLGGMKEGQRASGVVAQELKETLPDSVYPFDVRLRPGDAESSEILGYDPNQILFHAVLALQQVDKRLNELEAIIKGKKA
jgi:hypothetical protein